MAVCVGRGRGVLLDWSWLLSLVLHSLRPVCLPVVMVCLPFLLLTMFCPLWWYTTPVILVTAPYLLIPLTPEFLFSAVLKKGIQIVFGIITSWILFTCLFLQTLVTFVNKQLVKVNLEVSDLDTQVSDTESFILWHLDCNNTSVLYVSWRILIMHKKKTIMQL